MPGTPNSIITPQTPKSGAAIHTAQQNTWPPTTTPTNTTLLMTAGSNGGRLTRLLAVPHESTGAVGVMQVYRDVGSAGASKYLAFTQTCANDTVSGTDAPTPLDFGFSDTNAVTLQANERLYVAHSLASKAVGFVAE